jgi:4-diphosphocytidyl-2-C-methyl-D-erythritol kinase
MAAETDLPMVLSENAPAKLNLFLHVLERQADGYHRLESLVSFADFGDEVTLDLGAAPGLEINGPFAPGLAPGRDNLILKAEAAFLAAFPAARTGRFGLEKHLPIASGIGGGSADAAAALRLLARANAIAPDHPALLAAACALGADVPVCLRGAPCLMRGIGHDLSAPLCLPPFGLVLVNPKITLETRQVFAALGLQMGQKHPAPSPPFDGLPETVLKMLLACRNDLQAPALRLCPQIGAILAQLSENPACLLARMSGSGATCFGLYQDEAQARQAAQTLADHAPDWWIRASRTKV